MLSIARVALVSIVLPTSSIAQVRPHAGMLRHPDVSAESIVFVYADDLWLVARTGGAASPLASPPGPEAHPKFSPDGRGIAFQGSYDSGRDLYTVPVEGGVPTRVTHHPSGETLCDWTPDGKLLFFTNGFAGRDRMVELYTVAATGGLPEKLPVPYGAFGAISPSGEWLAYTPHSIDERTWKRYRGGMATDVWLFNIKNNASKRATDWEGTDTQPMWRKDEVYYLSDEGPSHRLNIWNYQPATGRHKQVTRYSDYDVKWPSIGPGPQNQGEIVFQHGAELLLLDLATEKATAVIVTVPGARPTLRSQTIDASDYVTSWDISPSGKRALVSGRGDVWTLPAKEGSPRNVTRTSGVYERDPAWSPDGMSIAWFSDASGEYELYTTAADGRGETKRLTHDGKHFRARPVWSPDSKSIAFTDKTGAIYVVPSSGGDPKLVDRDPWQGDLRGESPSWSHDSRWLAFSRQEERSNVSTIWLYEVETAAKHQVTSGMFYDSRPLFDRKGDWLYYESRREFTPTYSELDTTWVYLGTQVILAVPLRVDVVSPFLAKSDEEMPHKGGESGDDDKTAKSKKDDAKKANTKKDDAKKESAKKDGEKKIGEKDDAKKDDDDDEDKKAESKPREKVEIALEGFEARAIQLPVKAGSFGDLAVNDEGALLYLRHGSRASDDDDDDEKAQKGSIRIFDPSEENADERKEKTVLTDASSYAISANGKKILVPRDDGAVIAGAKADAKPEKVVTDGMHVSIDPRAEWREVFDDAWRIERDWFYDPNMHNVNWSKVKADYAPMLADCASRSDLAYILREMISELNVGHAYYADDPRTPSSKADVGLLGCDFSLDSGAWRVAKLYSGAPWDSDARNPLMEPGVDVKIGDWVLAVNGAPLDVKSDPWASFENLAGHAVTLTVSKQSTRDASARDVVVKLLESERDLRYRAWIEKNRAYVDKKTNGKVGYVYVPSTGIDGQNDLVRQFFGQIGKDALIVDERWNSGGQIPTRFVELLDRKVTNYWARRDAKDWTWPPDGQSGPKCMLINGLSGSGGDAFPAYFKMMGLGPLIGTRTWGGLVGLSGNPAMVDGSSLRVPTFGYFDKDGTWGIEGHGVDPDILVLDDPALMKDGADPQLDVAIATMLAEIEKHPYHAPKRPAYPDRSGMGLVESDR